MAASVAATKGKGTPILSLIVGTLFLFLCLFGTLLHIWTSEAFFLPPHSVTLFPSMSILAQPINLARGLYPVQMATAVTQGWTIEAIFLACVAGFDIMHFSVKRNNPRLAWAFLLITVALLGFDGWTDYQFTSSFVGMWGAVAFSLTICVVVFFFGTIGAEYIAHGIKGLR